MNIFKLKSKISNPVIYILLLLGFGISLSCIRNKYIIDDYRGIDGLDPNAPKFIVFFNSRLEPNYTKSMDIPFPKD